MLRLKTIETNPQRQKKIIEDIVNSIEPFNVDELIRLISKSSLPTATKRVLMRQYSEIPRILDNIEQIEKSTSRTKITELRRQTYDLVRGESPPIRELRFRLLTIVYNKNYQNLGD
jgi:hypothetical protein